MIERAEEMGNREAGCYFEVDEKAIRNWRKQKDSLMKMGRKRSNRHGIVKWPALEKKLHGWILEQRNNGRSISIAKIRLQVKCIADDMKIPYFKGGVNWVHLFMRRNNLRVRTRTTVSQAVPGDSGKKKASFLNFTKEAIEKGKYSLRNVINVDEVPLTFDCPLN